VAEGTIFRAFPTKEALIDAVLNDVFDVRHTCDELAEIDLGQHLEDRLVTAVGVLQARLRRVFALFHSMRLSPPLKQDPDSFRARQRTDNEQLNAAIAALLEPDHDRLRFNPVEAATAVRTVTFALTHPIIGEDRFAEPEKIVNLVLHGILDAPTIGGRGC
jgi:AcrR family transcriptional regulator